MARSTFDAVSDPESLLSQQDHMRDMERVSLEVVAIHRPLVSVARLVGRIDTTEPAPWLPPNQAVRIEVETPEGQRPVSRIYTIRSFDAATCLAEIDFVLHEDDSPAMRWLNAARPGTRVGLIGPRQHMIPAHVPGKRAAIFADETAIPAVYAILRAWPQSEPGSIWPGSIWIETGEPGAFDELPRLPGLDYHLIHRLQPAGTTRALLKAARGAITSPQDWTLWAAGERQEMRDLRSHFRDLGMTHDDLRVTGYWKHGTSSSDLDQIRLQEYSRIRQKGLRLEDLDDADLPI